MGFLSSLLSRPRKKDGRCLRRKGSYRQLPCNLKPHRLALEPLEERQLLSVLFWDPDGSSTGNDYSSGTNMGGADNWMKTDAWVDSSGGRHTWNNANGDEAVFLGGTGSMTVNLNSAVTAAKTTIQTAGYTLSGSALTLTGTGTTIAVNQSATISSAITAGSNQQWDVALGKTLSASGAVGLAGYSLTVQGQGNTTLTGVISGTGSTLTKAGTGTLTLIGTNTYTGGTTLSAGILNLGSAGALGSTGTITFGGGTLQYSTSNQTDYSSRFSSAANQAYNIDTNGQSVTFASALMSTTGSLTKIGSGSLTLSNANNAFTGGATVNGGTLVLAASTTLADDCDLTINAGATVSLTASDNAIWYSAYSSGDLVINGGTLSADSSGSNYHQLGFVYMNGNAVITATHAGDPTWHIFPIRGIATTSSSNTISADVCLLAVTPYGMEFNVGSGSSLTVSGSLYDCPYGSGPITKTGSGTLTLSGANTYTGGTTVGAGILNLGSAGALGSTGTITFGGGTLQYSASNQTDYSSRFSSAANQAYKIDTNGQSVTFASALVSTGGTLTKLGTNTLTLTGNSTYSGGTTISAGTLQLGNGSTSGSITGNVANNGILVFNRSNSVEFVGIVSGTGSLTKLGANTLTLSGNNIYTGGTTITAGTVAFASGGLASTGTININGNSTIRWVNGNTDDISSRMNINNNVTATFDIGSNNVTFASNSLNYGSLTKAGSGTLTLTGTFSSFWGNVTISEGAIQVGTGGTSGEISLTTGNIVNYGELVVNRSDITGFGCPISGPGNIVQCGAGTLILSSNASTYTGDTIISNGTLSFLAGCLGDDGDVIFANDATLEWFWQGNPNTDDISSRIVIEEGVNATFDTRLNNIKFSTVIRGDSSSSITKVGSSTLTFAAPTSYVGSTIVNEGALVYEDSVTVSSNHAITANNDAHLYFEDGLVLGANSTLTLNDYPYVCFSGTQSITGTGKVILNVTLPYSWCSAGIYLQGTDSSTPATLTIGSGVTIGGMGPIRGYYSNDTLLNQGIIQAENGTLTIESAFTNEGTVKAEDETLNITNACTNQGTFFVVGSGVLTHNGVEFRGSAAAISGTELWLHGFGMNDDAESCEFQISVDGGANYTTTAELTADNLSYLQGNLLRDTAYQLRIVATDANGVCEIYDTGSLATQDIPDASGWRKIKIESVNPSGPSFESFLNGSSVNLSGVSAGSSMGSILQSLSGLVKDGTLPIVDGSTPIQITRWHDASDQSQSVWTYGAEQPAGAGSVPTWFNIFTDALAGAIKALCSNDPVRYFDGAVDYSTTDLQSDGLGESFAQDRTWTNFTMYSANQRNGNGWIDSSLPTIQQSNQDQAISIVRSAMDVETFEWATNQYVPTSYVADTLVHDTTNHEFVWADSAGNEVHFYDFSENTPTGRAGQMKSKTDTNGLLTQVTAWTATGAVEEVRRRDADDNDVESWLYTYLSGSDPNAGLLSTVQLRQSDGQSGWTLVRQVEYQYYVASESFGYKGDLKTATVKDATGNVLGTDYYRYHTMDLMDSIRGTMMMDGGYRGGLKYVFDSESYARLCAAVGNPLTATDAQVAPYAQHYFEYDATRRCTQHDIQGTGGTATDGIGSFTYEYFASNVFSADPNDWQRKTIETLPDGNENIVYCNASGLLILKDFNDISDAANPALSGQHWLTYNEYDSQGRAILEAEPSAVTDYEIDANGDLVVTLAASSGLIHLTDYYATTTATDTTAGGVQGFVQNIKIKQGSSGTPVLQETRSYYNKINSGKTNVVLADDTVYRNTDGTGGETTSYVYTWNAGTVGVQSATVTSPIVTDATTAFYDLYGRPVWIKDAEGFLTYIEYDAVTGAAIKTIADVDTTETGDFTDLPTGWSTPIGGGLHLITTMVVDALGRTTKITDAEGNVTYIVYNDVNHEVRIYAGWNAATHKTTGSVQVVRQDMAGNYTETLTFDWNDANGLPVDGQGRPTGAESLTDARTLIQSLSRSLMNAVGQVTQSREYISLSSLTYSTARNLGTSGVNYLETTMAYEPWGAQVVTVDPSGTVDEVFNDSLGRLTQEWVGTDDVPTTDFNGDSVIDSLDFRYWVSQNGSATTGPAGTSMKLRVKYCYDVDGKLTSLTDADQNTTTWEYDGYGRLIEETNELNASRLFSYDMLGNLLSKTDRDGRVTTYTYDDRNRLTEENWLDSQQNVIREIDYSYDGNSLLLSASDPDATYEYTYDGVGRLVSETQEIDGLTPTIVLASQYDDTGNRTQVAATVGGTADFVNDYTYDALGRTTSLSQHGTTGGNAVAEKLVDFTYNAAGRWNTITRYADLASTDLVATGTYGYDLAGRLTSLTYTKGIITLVDYDWTYNAASQLTQYINSIDGTVDYTNDATGQLTGADYDYQTDESYTYDENGNRTNTGYVTGDNNQLLSDGTYRYSYDPEGNRVAKFIDTDIDGVLDAGDTDVTIYAWDYRNRLTEVSHYDDYTAYSGEEPDQVVDYAYDYANRLVGKVLDADGDGTVDSSSAFVYDGNQIVLQFEKTGTDDISASSLSNRYFWGPAVDQLLAQESPLPLGEGLGEGYDLTTPGDVFWPLTDNLNTVRDLATYDSNTDTTTIANHRVYDAFGNLRSQTNAAVDCLFGYTGRQFDEDISLQNNLNRWYDASVGRWVSNDPIGYEGGINLFAYVNNSNCKRCQC